MNKILLYHYSNKDFTGSISPAFFGDNSYSLNSAGVSGTKRAFFYLEAGAREYYLDGARFLYTAEIERARLYDIDKDTRRIIPKLAGRDIYAVLKAKGYAGAIGNNGHACAVLFRPIKIKTRETLTK
jgi:hypothetical protein